MKKIINQIRKILAMILRNKNLRTDAYLYDMASILGKNVTVIHRYKNQYIITDENDMIFKINRYRPIDVLDMVKFQKIKVELMKIGGTPQHAYFNIDKLFNSKKKEYGNKISMIIHR
nr:MAG TPA: hypothetical protein [Caudoviricetes sp.]